MKYQNNYISLFIIKLDFGNDLDDTIYSNIVTKMKKAFSKDFSQTRESIVNESKTTIHQSNIDTKVTTSKQIQLISNDQISHITLNKNSVTLQYTKYDSYIEIRKRIVIINDLLTKSINTNNYKRVGMRYINNIKLPTKSISDCFNWKGYIHDKLNASIKLIDKNEVIRQFEVIELMFEEFNLRMRIQAGIPNKAYPARITSKEYLIDLDCYSHDITKDNEVLDVLDVLHIKNSIKFEELIGDRLRGLMNE